MVQPVVDARSHVWASLQDCIYNFYNIWVNGIICLHEMSLTTLLYVVFMLICDVKQKSGWVALGQGLGSVDLFERDSTFLFTTLTLI